METTNDAIVDGSGSDAGAKNNNNQQQQQQTISTSNLTSMTGNNGNEVIQNDSRTVEEFDTDPKWEITTLEKASYDCSDMYAEASPDQLNSAQATQSASDTNLPSDCMLGKTDNRQDMTESMAEIPQTNSSISGFEDCSQTTISATENRQILETTTECSSENEIEPHKQTNDASEKRVEEVQAEVQESAKTTSSPHAAADTTVATTKAEFVGQQQQDMPKDDEKCHETNQRPESKSVEETLRDVDAGKTDQHDDGTFSLSQTNVDPQMEQMIDDIVELGGCQQFAETLRQHGEEIDREKEVEIIQREISRASSSLMEGDETDMPAEMNAELPTLKKEENVVEEVQTTIEKDTLINTQAEGQQLIYDAKLVQDPQLKEDTIEKDDAQEKKIEKKKGEERAQEKSLEATENVQYTQVNEHVSQDKREDSEEVVGPKSDDLCKTNSSSVKPIEPPKKRRVVVEKKVEDDVEAEAESDKTVEDKKSLPERPVRQARLRATKRAASPELPAKEAPEKRRKSKESDSIQERPTKQKLEVKVPLSSRSASERKTIATSAPLTTTTTIPEPKRKADTSFNDFEYKKYRCEKCKYSTDRLNNIVHHKKSTCSFFQQHYADHVAAQVESWKRSIQSPKSNSKRSAR